jgi:hypothetical protein
MGPALLSQALHRLQGERGSVKASDIRSIDWELGQLEVRAAPTALLEARRRR